MVTPAGKFRELVTFSERAVTSDGYGNSQGDFAPQFTVRARLLPRFGSEAVQAARLQGRQPFSLIVRHSPETVQVTTDWMATNARTGVQYNIRSIVNADERRRELEMLVEAGVGI